MKTFKYLILSLAISILTACTNTVPAAIESTTIDQTTQSISATTAATTVMTHETTKTEHSKIPTIDISDYGELVIDGMPEAEYSEAMNAVWEEIVLPGTPEIMDIDLNKAMDYSLIEKYILNLSRYEEIKVFSIGKTELGRNIYMLEIGRPKEGESKEEYDNRRAIMLSGSVHALEGAGAEYIIKAIYELIQAPGDDGLLQDARITAIPLVNPDGREYILDGGDNSRKSNSRGVDLNRNLPSLNAGQLKDGYLKEDYPDSPGLAYYPGEYLGSEKETKAMMKWFEVYVPKAACYIDLHQQGDVIYYDKVFLSSNSDNMGFEFSADLIKTWNNRLRLLPEKDTYGLLGVGGTLTDYARSVAEGMTFSREYGRQVMIIDGVEHPLISFKDIDDVIDLYSPVNEDFVAITLEIGAGREYLGFSETAMKLKNDRYYIDKWDDFIKTVIDLVK